MNTEKEEKEEIPGSSTSGVGAAEKEKIREVVEKYSIHLSKNGKDLEGNNTRGIEKDIDFLKAEKQAIVAFLQEEKKRKEELEQKLIEEEKSCVIFRKITKTEQLWVDEPVQIEKRIWQKKIIDYLPEPRFTWKDGAGFIEVDGLLLSEHSFEEILNMQERTELTMNEAIEIVRKYGDIEGRKKREAESSKWAKAVFNDDEMEAGYEQACENAGIPKFLRR